MRHCAAGGREEKERDVEYPVNANRRTFLRRGAMGAGAVWMMSLQELSARAAKKGPTVVERPEPVRTHLAEER